MGVARIYIPPLINWQDSGIVCFAALQRRKECVADNVAKHADTQLCETNQIVKCCHWFPFFQDTVEYQTHFLGLILVLVSLNRY